jgi:hypothetical protein
MVSLLAELAVLAGLAELDFGALASRCPTSQNRDMGHPGVTPLSETVC